MIDFCLPFTNNYQLSAIHFYRTIWILYCLNVPEISFLWLQKTKRFKRKRHNIKHKKTLQLQLKTLNVVQCPVVCCVGESLVSSQNVATWDMGMAATSFQWVTSESSQCRCQWSLTDFLMLTLTTGMYKTVVIKYCMQQYHCPRIKTGNIILSIPVPGFSICYRWSILGGNIW